MREEENRAALALGERAFSASLSSILILLAGGCGRLGFDRRDGVAVADALGFEDVSRDAGGNDARLGDGESDDAETGDAATEDALAGDASAGDVSAGDASGACGPFTVLGELAALNGPDTELAPAISPDHLSLIFQSDRPGSGSVDLWISTRTSAQGPFGPPSELPGSNTAGEERDAALSADGLELYFSRDDTLRLATRATTTDNFGPSIQVDIMGLPTNAEDVSALWLSTDGSTAYFTLLDDRGYAIGVARRSSPAEPFVMDRRLTELGSSGDEQAWPSLSPDELEIFFYARPSNRIWRSIRRSAGEPFDPPEPMPELGALVTTDPELTRDRRTLYFAHLSAGTWDIWVATRSCP